ncbi:C40 family peptidase [Desulforamulus ruminis]|uniref:NLP/P60 protein n=1 Tax=Desulforamulus ruminis (strain ATCC 23193 / DSM 2154 / NCIMB 8452 / DL) TaxID=696281 RepID=F6DV78_DESRL|nr:LysM peptidoglycan-binding domain-containing C40 family peptidase [Desulforamulus ruminis]AEG59144.1 NLP/P60 protein [Desulforamulus ruminis DSM 2154]
MSIRRKLSLLVASVCLATVLGTGSAYAAQVTVAQGDSLWAIANRNGTTVEALKQINQLTSDNLSVGQVLNLPDSVNQSVRSSANQSQQQVSRGGGRITAVLDFAKTLIGSKYRSGGESPAGFDCSGYVRYVFKNFNIDLVHTAAGQYNAGTVIKKEQLEPADLVFFNTGGSGINHSGIYIGNNQFIHSSSSRGVRIDSLADSYWSKNYRGANRIIP